VKAYLTAFGDGFLAHDREISAALKVSVVHKNVIHLTQRSLNTRLVISCNLLVSEENTFNNTII
jgi:hypothetical protein